MAEQTVTLQPGESEKVAFESIPHEAKTYQVSVDGLTGSFRAAPPPVPSDLLIDYQEALGYAYWNVENGYPDSFVYIPDWGLQYASAAIPQLKNLMIAEAISIGMISSAGDCYFTRDIMYFNDGTTIVPYWWPCPYCAEKLRSPALLQAHLEASHWEIINSKGTITGFKLEYYDDTIYPIGVKITWRNDSPFAIQGHVRIVASMSYGGSWDIIATSGQDAISSAGQSISVQFPYDFRVTRAYVTLTRIDGPWPGLVLAREQF